MYSICQSVDHPVHACPYLLFSANVESVSSQKTSTSSLYAGAAKAPRTVAFQSTLSSLSKSHEEQGERRSTEREKVREKGGTSELTRERERTSELTKENKCAKESSNRSRQHRRESHERDGWGVARDQGGACNLSLVVSVLLSTLHLFVPFMGSILLSTRRVMYTETVLYRLGSLLLLLWALLWLTLRQRSLFL